MSEIKRIAEHYGWMHQRNKAIEELGELIVAIARNDRENIIEEIADVMVMIMQIEHFLLCEEEVCDIIEQKLDRQIERIKQESFDCAWRCAERLKSE